MIDTNRLYATDLPEAQWFNSSFSDGGEQCVEVADTRPTRGFVALRDSKDPNGPALAFTEAAVHCLPAVRSRRLHLHRLIRPPHG
ncbi:DUF397 domain-containing protein [Streptomyces subrutilus]|uniref:DUF397 domain-containing protein n=1 Tax=Streptomyces subrutilus TaxID=36818 RepID=A0A1E5Q0H8_9ACTN|nr:DUF397 domain-containing protein [Streptomyces subrutilus]OEJ35309.1 hypothetical protein BGK67_32045 [Streptomyces subrutilus]